MIKKYEITATVTYDETYSGRVTAQIEARSPEDAEKAFRHMVENDDLDQEISESNMSVCFTSGASVYDEDPVIIKEEEEKESQGAEDQGPLAGVK